MPGPVLSFWKIPVSLALTQNPKKKKKKNGKREVPPWGGMKGLTLPLPLAGSGQGAADRDICSLAVGVENYPKKEDHGRRKIKTVSECCG